MNNSFENGNSKVHQNKRKLLFFSPLIFILLVLGLFILIYMTDDMPFDVSVVIFLLCSFVLFMVLLSPFFSEPLKIEENEDSLICHLFYGKKVVSLTENCAYNIQLYTDGGWVISFSTGLLPVRFSNEAFADLSKMVDKLKDYPNSQKRNAFIITMNAVIGIVAVMGGVAMLVSGNKGGIFCNACVCIGCRRGLYLRISSKLSEKSKKGNGNIVFIPGFCKIFNPFLSCFGISCLSLCSFAVNA